MPVHKRQIERSLPLALLAAAALLLAPAARAQTAFQLVLTSKIDTKSAKPGDPVQAKAMQRSDVLGTSVPEDTKVVGHITAVTHQPLTLVFTFDSVQQKNHPPVAIQTLVTAIAPRAELQVPLGSPRGAGGYTVQNPTNVSAAVSPDALTSPGSTIRNVSLDNGGTLSSSKDFKLDTGTRVAVSVSPAKQ